MSAAAHLMAIIGVLLTTTPVLWAGGSLAGILTVITGADASNRENERALELRM